MVTKIAAFTKPKFSP